MLPLSTTLLRVKRLSRTRSPVHRHLPGTRMPVMRQTPAKNYYFDAKWHSRKSLRALLNAPEQSPEEFGSRSRTERITEHMDRLLDSLCPRLEDEARSRSVFLQLLNQHLSTLTESELGQLRRLLTSAQYDCDVTEPVDALKSRTLLTAPEFDSLLDALEHTLRSKQAKASGWALSATRAQTVRDRLAQGALWWRTSDRSLACLNPIVSDLAAILEVPVDLPLRPEARSMTRASMIGWQQGCMLIDREAAAALGHPQSDELFARLQRDLLECLLLRKLNDSGTEPRTDAATDPWSPPAHRQQQVWRWMEQIESLPPSGVLSEPARRQLRDWLASLEAPGCVQVTPTVGAYLGHALIDPHLSASPDRLRPKTIAGTLYMQAGSQLQANDAVISEWPMRWQTSAESQADYPACSAWHLRVPAEARQLDEAALALVRDWKARGIRYRFAETAPDLPASGCRVTVWEAVRQALPPGVREHFDSYTLGLPLPDSPTELWERLRSFKVWLTALARD